MKSLYNKITEYFDIQRSIIAKAYADWRVNATVEEKHSYNPTDRVLLTFDDFADKKTLKSLLKILKKEHVKAVFFIIGDWANENPDLVAEIRNDGHWIGNHTKSHKNLLKINEKEVKDQILGGYTSNILRPPYGRYNKKTRKIAKELGYKICYWDIDSEDWKGISKNKIKSRILRSLHPSACILMHLNGPHTLDALPDIIKGIRNKDYELCHEGNELIL